MKQGLLVMAAWLVLCASGVNAEEILDATNLDLLREKAGTDAVVEGYVVDVGKTQKGNITFLNIGMPKKQGFVAVIFQRDYGSFPDGFEHYQNLKVRVRGGLELYRSEQPQITLHSPDQIEIVAE